KMTTFLRQTPWDKRTFRIDTYELTASHEEALKESNKYDGHFTFKVDPLENPKNIIEHGFYYMDSLIEPVCSKADFRLAEREGLELTQDYNKKEILKIAEESFIHGRFHRDFYVPNKLADIRYMRWVEDLMEKSEEHTSELQSRFDL